MNFSQTLQTIMNRLKCNISDICEKSGLSYSQISRYASGKRTPRIESEYFEKLVKALESIANDVDCELDAKSIRQMLEDSISDKEEEEKFDFFIENLNIAQEELKISTVKMAGTIGYDASFLSRVKSKDRRPADTVGFMNKVCEYMANYINLDVKRRDIFLQLAGKEAAPGVDMGVIIRDWMMIHHEDNNEKNNVHSFLSSLDSFDLNDYIGEDFSKIKIPTTPIVLKSSKTYFGVEGRKHAEADFLKTTLLSKSNEAIFFYNDFPISEAGSDEDFKKKWIFVISRILKKGLHLNMVHNLDRPTGELFLGLTSWIPVYMVGSISPYYFKIPPSNLLSCSHMTSGQIAQYGELIGNDENKGVFYVTTKREEVDFAKEKSKYLLSKATPLMKIYKSEDLDEFKEFIEANNDYKKVEIPEFKNIDFFVKKGKWVCVNKMTNPEIHFCIFHSKLVNALGMYLGV